MTLRSDDPDEIAGALIGGQFEYLPVPGAPYSGHLRRLCLGLMVLQSVADGPHIARGAFSPGLSGFLLHAFVATVGLTPPAYLKLRRLVLVRRLLRSAHERPALIKSVALAHGFWAISRRTIAPCSASCHRKRCRAGGAACPRRSHPATARQGSWLRWTWLSVTDVASERLRKAPANR